MSEFGQNLKNAVMKGIEAIGNTASSFASNTKQKVEEFNLANQLKDIYTEIGEKVYALSKQGIELPAVLSESIQHAAETEAGLNSLREQKDESSENKSGSESETDDSAPAVGENCQAEAAVYTAKDNHDVPVICVDEDEDEDTGCKETAENSPLSSAINDLFENMPPVDKMVDKVNSSLDELGDSLRKFSGEFDKQLNEFADQMMGKDDKKD